jgi:hypothetical protein
LPDIRIRFAGLSRIADGGQNHPQKDLVARRAKRTSETEQANGSFVRTAVIGLTEMLRDALMAAMRKLLRSLRFLGQ